MGRVLRLRPRRVAISVMRAVAGVSVAVAMLMGGITPASADHSWGNYHWARTANPFTLQLGDNVSSTWDSHLATTSSDWSVSSVLDTKVVEGRANPRNCRPTSGRVEVCSSTYGFNGWLGVAQIWLSGAHITQAITKLNDSYFNTATYNKPEWRNLVMCQEVGHAFGLDHQDEDFYNANLGTCMDYTDRPQDNQHPNKHDYDQLETIYSHSDSTNTISSSSTTSAGRDTVGDLSVLGDTPAAWGQAVAFAANGLPRVLVKDLGAGQRVITFVTWAPDAPQAQTPSQAPRR